MEELQTSDEFKDVEPNPKAPKAIVINIQRCDIVVNSDTTDLDPIGIPRREIRFCVNEEEMENKINDILQLLG
jgi:hypothetical protein